MTQTPLEGVSTLESIDNASAQSKRTTQFYSMLGSRSIWHEGWKAVTTHATMAGWSNFNADDGELYNTDVDRSELNDLAAAGARSATAPSRHWTTAVEEHLHGAAR